MAGLGEVVPHLPHYGVGGIGKVDGHRTSYRRAHLVHQAAGLAKVDVLRILADLGDVHRRESPAAAEAVEDVSDQHLVGGGGGQPGAGEHIGGDVCVKSCGRIALFLDFGRHSPHKGCGGVALLHVGEQLVQPYLQSGIALGEDADDI